jgi:tetratricopeptide (TPR) repeat protein
MKFNDRLSLGLLCFGISCLASPGVLADRLHLEGGGTIESARWWVEDDTLFYETAAGTVGIPRGSVLRIVKTETQAGASEPTTTEASPQGGHKTVTESDRARKVFESGLVALREQKFEEAASYFAEALQKDADLYEARVGYAIAQMRSGHDGLALSVILEGVSRHPKISRLHEILGDLRNREERIEDARHEWRLAFKLDPTDRVREKIERAERELASRSDFAFATTPHFNVRYDDHADGPLAHQVMETLEADWWTVSDRLDHQPLQPINVLVYSKVQFQSLTRAPAEVAGLFDGKIRVPLGGLDRLTTDARRVLRHELTHAVLHSKTKGNCPRWLHEGLAQILDGTRLTGNAERALAKTLAEEEAKDPFGKDFSYPAALSLSEWIIRVYGFDDLLDLLNHLADGGPWQEVVENAWNISWPVLLDHWAEDVRTVLE